MVSTKGNVRVAAIDLGATSGRVVAVTVGPKLLKLQEVHRFKDPTILIPKDPKQMQEGPESGVLTLDVLAIWEGITKGLYMMAYGPWGGPGPIDGIGIDTWAVDYALLDADGALMANPTNYRDARTNGVPAKLFSEHDINFTELYQHTGIQFLPFNTVFQLAAEKLNNPARFANAKQLLMIPDLFNYWLTGAKTTEITNASSTALVNPVTRDWDYELLDKLAYPRDIFPKIVEPGTIIGETDGPKEENIPVIAVGSHDTASAVVAVPMSDDVEHASYISSGTWSLVGLELDKPVLTDEAREINATNELGVDGTVRFLRNTMGLWLLSQCHEQWDKEGRIPNYKSGSWLTDILNQAAAAEPHKWLIDADSQEFLAPGKMATRIANAAKPADSSTLHSTATDPTRNAAAIDTIRHSAANREAVQSAESITPSEPLTVVEIVRCIMDSLALAYAKAIRELSLAAGRKIETIYIVGGGSQNQLLCQLTADATSCKVVAGPVEAAALGNALVQARTLGVIEGGLPQMRALVRKTQTLKEYYPTI